VRANHKQKSSVKDNSSHPVWDPDGKMPFVFAVRCKVDVLISVRLAQQGAIMSRTVMGNRAGSRLRTIHSNLR